MTKLRKPLAVSLVATMLAACSGNSGTATTTTAPTTDEKKTVVVAIDADLNTMDSSIATDGNSFIMQTLVQAGLTELDASGVSKPDMAESWEMSEDGLTYTFHLADGVKWSDGTPVTAQDFVYSWRRLDDPATASEYAFILTSMNVKNAAAVFAGEKPVEELGVEAVDDKTFVVHLDQPCGFFLSLTAFPSLFPLNQKFVEEKKDQYALSPNDLLFNGPYEMTDWQAGSSYTFAKRADYKYADTIDTDEITFKFIQDTQSAMLEYQQGNIDAVKLNGEMVDLYKNEPGFTSRLQGYLWYLAPNLRDTAIGNKNLRMAISYGIDREQIAVNVLKDGSVAAEGFIPREFAYDTNGKDYRETAGKIVSYDPEKAKEYYEKAKAELGGDVTFDLLFEDSEASKAVAENIQQMLQTNCPGLTVTLNSKPKKTRLQLMQDHTFQVALHRWGPDYADPQTFIDLYINDEDGNALGYASEAYDALVEKATKGEDAANAEKRWANMVEAEKMIVVDDVAVIPLYQNGGAMMINPKLTGFEFHTGGVDNFRHITHSK